MKLSSEQIKALKIKLALDGVGSKKQLADKIGCHPSQITLILDTAKCPERHSKKLLSYIK